MEFKDEDAHDTEVRAVQVPRMVFNGLTNHATLNSLSVESQHPRSSLNRPKVTEYKLYPTKG